MVLNYKMSKVKKSFKVIIAGSRSFSNYNLLEEKCNKILTSISDEIWIISGCAKGTDLLGEKYAKNKGYYLMECPAPWDDIQNKPQNQIGITKNGDKYWKLAGLHRNELMAKEADACIVFWDGKSTGTKNMIDLAKKYKLKLKIINI